MNLSTKTNLLAAAVIVPVAVLLGCLMNLTISTAKKDRLEEKFKTMILEVDARCTETDIIVAEDDDWNAEYVWYSRSMATYFEQLDRRQDVFAAVYDKSFNPVTDRNPTYEAHPFNPFSYPGFVELLKYEPSGVENVVFNLVIDGKAVKRPVRIYFRKVPVGYDKNYLTVVIAIPFIDDSAELSASLYTLIYSIYGLAIISFAILIFTGTKYFYQYKQTISDLRKKWGLS